MRNMWMIRSAVMVLLLVGSVATAESQIVVVSSSVQERAAGAGETYTGQIRLRNEGRASGGVRIYQTDYLFHADGRTLYPEPGSHTRSNAKWLTVTPTTITVPPGQTVEVSYTLRVPSLADSAAGTYWSMIMVEPIEPLAAEPTRGRQPEVGLRTVVRFGIQVATHTGAEVAHRLNIGQPRIIVDTEKGRAIEFELSNSGAAGYRPLVSLEVYDAEGNLAATAESQRGLMYPGTSVLQQFELKALQSGTYEAMIVVDTGAPDVFGGQFTLTITSER